MRGFTAGAKEKLPKWITERPTDDEQQQTISQDEMDVMLGEYYRLRGWDAQGVPRRETLERLSLTDAAFRHRAEP